MAIEQKTGNHFTELQQQAATALAFDNKALEAINKNNYHKSTAFVMANSGTMEQAKLIYLQQAEGRMKSPAYWAGIVLIGDAGTEMLVPENKYARWLWTIGVLSSLAYVVLFNRKNKEHNP